MSQHNHPMPAEKLKAAAWLGQAGLYRTRFDAVQNGEQLLKPVSDDELFELACKHVLEACIHA